MLIFPSFTSTRSIFYRKTYLAAALPDEDYEKKKASPAVLKYKSMSKYIAKSPEMLRKEAEIKDLRAQLKKRQTTLKSLKTRLKNTQSDIEEIQRKVHTGMLHKAEAVDALRMEIAELARQLKKVKGMSRMDKEQLQMMADEISSDEMFGPAYQEYKAYKEKQQSADFDFDEYERARIHDVFQQFQVKPEEKEQRDIRKVFLKLSQKFHPDLAKGEKETADFHSLMQQINEAYQANDIQTLLELESLYLAEELDFTTKAVTVDVLQQEIDRLNRDLNFIDHQIGRTSEEIKNLRQSQLGVMLTATNRMEREGEGFDTMTAYFDQMIQMFTQLRDGLKDSIELGRISPKLMDTIMGQEEDFEDEEDDFIPGGNPMDMFMKMMDDDEEAMEFLGGLFDKVEVENPKFPIGSSVRVKANVGTPYNRKIKMKGWEGRVLDAFYNSNEQVIYVVSFDSITIGQMAPDFIKKALDEEGDFQDFELLEPQLEACQPRDTLFEATKAYKNAYHQHYWTDFVEPDQAKRFKKIMVKHPDLSDDENWNEHLEQRLTFPFEAKTRGLIDSKADIAVNVTDFQLYDEEYGYIMEIKMKGRSGKRGYPLFDLRMEDTKIAQAQILDDYSAWVWHSLVG